MKKTRIIIFSVIVIICFIAIGVGLYVQFTENDYKKAIEKTNSGSEISEDEISKLKNNFDNIFQNDITTGTLTLLMLIKHTHTYRYHPWSYK